MYGHNAVKRICYQILEVKGLTEKITDLYWHSFAENQPCALELSFDTTWNYDLLSLLKDDRDNNCWLIIYTKYTYDMVNQVNTISSCCSQHVNMLKLVFLWLVQVLSIDQKESHKIPNFFSWKIAGCFLPQVGFLSNIILDRKAFTIKYFWAQFERTITSCSILEF